MYTHVKKYGDDSSQVKCTKHAHIDIYCIVIITI